MQWEFEWLHLHWWGQSCPWKSFGDSGPGCHVCEGRYWITSSPIVLPMRCCVRRPAPCVFVFIFFAPYDVSIDSDDARRRLTPIPGALLLRGPGGSSLAADAYELDPPRRWSLSDSIWSLCSKQAIKTARSCSNFKRRSRSEAPALKSISSAHRQESREEDIRKFEEPPESVAARHHYQCKKFNRKKFHTYEKKKEKMYFLL